MKSRQQSAPMPIPNIIAIDGPAASGKSTIGKRLADALDYLFFDTGVMYRAVTWAALNAGLDLQDRPAVETLAEALKIDIRRSTRPDQRSNDVFVDGRDISVEVRSAAVEDGVSLVSTYPGVRATLTAAQREIGERGRVVMVGRDIGTVVMPAADLKIYLDASARARAERRYREKLAGAGEADFAAILANVEGRDQVDSTRANAPLRIAPDAVRIDTENLDADQVFAVVFRLVSGMDPVEA